MQIGSEQFDTENNTYVMGILNVTPDSFSDGGKYRQMDRALSHAEEMIQEGAALIDVGGESTRPGYEMLTDEEEISRVVPVIQELKKRWKIPISIDTYKSEVARAAIDAGADLINDIWGLKYDANMADVIQKSGLPCCLMHNRKAAQYVDFISEWKQDLADSLALAEQAGIPKSRIILDPGIGFAKTYEMNLSAMRHLDELKEFGCPVLLGASKKSMIGLTLDLPVTERMEGTLATTVFGVMKGCAFIRVHDVKENLRAIRMTRAMLGK